jgi:Domain of unknown function (DUF222)/HNH endonuclease
MGIDHLVAELRAVVAHLDADRLEGSDALSLFESYVVAERLCCSAKLSLATRIESSNIWRESGHRNAASLIAETEGVGVGQAQSTLETGRALSDAPKTAEALRDGKLSEPQVKELAAAVAVDPGNEHELVDAAQGEPMRALRDRCRKTKARAASADPARTLAAIHADRHLRHWIDDQGAFCLKGRLTPDRGAQFLSVLDAATKDRFEEARKNGDRESMEAYAADALIDLACGDSSNKGRTKTIVNVRVDQEALFNREARGDELSEIDGIGEVPIPVIESLLSDSYLKVLFYQGTEVNVICHPGRYINAPIRTALQNDQPCCVVPGCGSTKFLEIDHIQPVEAKGPVKLSNLCRLCRYHHDKKTNGGYAVWKDDDGNWHFDPPPPFGQEPDLGGEPGGGLYEADFYRDDETTAATTSGADPPDEKSRRSARSGLGPRPKARSNNGAEPGESPSLFDVEE